MAFMGRVVSSNISDSLLDYFLRILAALPYLSGINTLVLDNALLFKLLHLF